MKSQWGKFFGAIAGVGALCWVLLLVFGATTTLKDVTATMGWSAGLLLIVGVGGLWGLHGRDQRRRDAEKAEQDRALAWKLHQAEQERIAQQQRDAEAAAERRREDLGRRFGPEHATRILAGTIWQGMTVEMLLEAKGPPEDISEKVLKTKTKHTYKYSRIAANRYAMKVMLEDGEVVGWEDAG